MKKVDEFNGKPIELDTDSGVFVCGELRNRDLSILKQELERDSKTDFLGKFFVKTYNGMEIFEARKKYFSDREDCYIIRGISTDRYNGKQDNSYKEEELYPTTPENTQIYEESLALIKKGWDLISQGHQMNKKLIK